MKLAQEAALLEQTPETKTEKVETKK